MADQIIKDIKLNFDARNSRVLSPLLFYTEQSIKYYTNKSLENYQTIDSLHIPIIKEILYELESSIFSDKYYGNDEEEINKYNKKVLTSLKGTLNKSNQYGSIENRFSLPGDIIKDQMYFLIYFISKLKKILKRNFKQMPISTARFSHFNQQITNYFFYDNFNISNDNDNFQQNDTKLNEILVFDTNRKDTEYFISIEKLCEFYDIISKYTKAFSLSPTFVISTLDSLNIILNSLFAKNDDNFDEIADKNDFHFFTLFRKFLIETSDEEEKMIKIKYFKLSMLIKMRLYFIIQKMYDCLTVLFQFIIMEQEQIYFEKEDDFFSFKRLFNEAFPETSKRSKIINNISSDQILDFYFSSNGNNGFILTNDGIFKINENKDEPINLIKIDFEEEENTKIQQIIKSCNKNNAKITFCNGILYFLSIEEKVIHNILVCSPKDSITDDDRPKLKESKIKENIKTFF